MTTALDTCGDLPERLAGPGEVLIREGDGGGRLFLLVDGDIAVTRGEVPVARIRTPGAMFGEMALLLGRPASATVTARAPSRLRVAEEGAAFLADHPEVALHVARMLAQRLHDATTYLADLKQQFDDRREHFGMVDRILGSLLNQQPEGAAPPPAAAADPRL